MFRTAVFSDGVQGAGVRLDNGTTLADDDGADRVVELLESALRTLGDSAVQDLEHVVVAAAGALYRPAMAEALVRALSEGGYVKGEVVVTTDVVAAHAGALHNQPGVVLSAGTGAGAFGVDGSGATTLVDGAGYLIGDAGSGFSVGRAGLAAALRHCDGRRGGSELLARFAAEQYGPLAELPGRVHADIAPACVVASFAPAVARAARDGDVVAIAIWRKAVTELVDTATAACFALPEQDRRIAVTGGLFDLDDLVTEPFSVTMAARAPGVAVRRAAGDAMAGAARLVDRPAGVYEDLLLRRPSSRDDHRA